MLKGRTELYQGDAELPGEEGCPRCDGTDQRLFQAVKGAAGALPRPIQLSKGLQESQPMQLPMRTFDNGADAQSWHVPQPCWLQKAVG